MDYFDLFSVFWCLISNLVTPLFDGLNDGLNNWSLGDLSDWGKGIGSSLWETKSSSSIGNWGNCSSIGSKS